MVIPTLGVSRCRKNLKLFSFYTMYTVQCTQKKTFFNKKYTVKKSSQHYSISQTDRNLCKTTQIYSDSQQTIKQLSFLLVCLSCCYSQFSSSIYSASLFTFFSWFHKLLFQKCQTFPVFCINFIQIMISNLDIQNLEIFIDIKK